MRSTLFYIPHHIGPLPVLGIGWGLLFLALGFAGSVFYRRSRGEGWSTSTSDWMTWAIGAAVIVFVLPRIEATFPDGMGGTYPVGLPVRGYGLMLMSGVIAAVGLCYYRAKQFGWSVDQLLSLGFATILSGIVGARIFFVVQKWSELAGDTLWEKLYEAFKFTEGGLVVYGSMIGGLIGIASWAWWRGYRLLALADLVMPGFLLGIAIGRIGCLMNGCCYGGVCDTNLPSISFPKGSLPYMDQLSSGELLGIRLAKQPTVRGPHIISSVRPGTWAQAQGLRPGQELNEIHEELHRPPRGSDPAGPSEVVAEITVDGQTLNATSQLPSRSLPTHPTQIYSAIDAAILAGFLFCIWPNVRHDGSVFALGLILYGISRMIEEWIRIDEAGQFGTSLSISQWISLAGISVGLAIMAIRWRQVPNRFWVAAS